MLLVSLSLFAGIGPSLITNLLPGTLFISNSIRETFHTPSFGLAHRKSLPAKIKSIIKAQLQATHGVNDSNIQ